MPRSNVQIRRMILLTTAFTAALFLTSSRDLGSLGVILSTWFLISLGAEALWHPGRDRLSSISLAPAAQVAALAALPALPGMGMVLLTSTLGSLLWRRRGLRHAAGRGLLVVPAALGAEGVLLLTGSRIPITLAPGTLGAWDPLVVPGLVLAGVVFLVLLQGATALAVSRSRKIPAWTAWRRAHGHETELVTSAAMVAVAVLTLVCYQALGFRGILLCVLPALFVREGSRRYLELELAQQKLLHNRRLVAKGEMAAEIGHELNNYLAAVLGRAQLLGRSLGADAPPECLAEPRAIAGVSKTMAQLAKGLMDTSHAGAGGTAHEINDLVIRTMEFIRPQEPFRELRFEFLPTPGIPAVVMDPGQIQQAMMTLFRHLAEHSDRETKPPVRIRTFNRSETGTVGIEITSTRSPEGSPVSDPGTEGREFKAVRRIMRSHKGLFEAGEFSDQGESFRLVLPAA